MRLNAKHKHMKTKRSTSLRNSIFVTFLFFLISNAALPQVTEIPDSLKTTKADTLKTATADSLKALPAAPVVAPAVVPVAAPKDTPAETPQEAPVVAPAETQKTDEGKTDDDPDKKKKDKKGKKNEIIFYGGLNYTQLGSSAGNYESEARAGYQIGGYYKQGRMFYWQAGARFASAMIGYKPTGIADFSDISVSDIDIPLTLGINFTSFMNRVLSVRLFASAVPAFTLKVGENPYGITKDNVNSFILYGQGGLGINVAFLVIEGGYNYGFNELLIDNTDSKPGQVFINLGFRF
jgi:hypothetical protein